MMYSVIDYQVAKLVLLSTFFVLKTRALGKSIPNYAQLTVKM
jgi:hypothetical protein